MTFRATVLTLYPEMFPGTLGLSLAGRALTEGTWSLDTLQIREFATDRHRTVDDTPAGGGAGMVLKADIIAKAVDHASPQGDPRPRLLMSPRGRPLTQALGTPARPPAMALSPKAETPTPYQLGQSWDVVVPPFSSPPSPAESATSGSTQQSVNLVQDQDAPPAGDPLVSPLETGDDPATAAAVVQRLTLNTLPTEG